MKRFLLSSLFVIAALAVQAQTVDEILDKYFAQTGGKDKWMALKSIKMSGKAKAQGMDLPIVVLQEAPNKMKLTINFQGKEIVQPAFDGQTAWVTNMMTMKPEKMETEDSELMKADTEVQDPFLNYKDKGYKAELQGKETIEGTECYKVKLTKKPVKVDGKEEENISYYFFSVADNVPIMVRSFGKKGPQKGQPVETYMSDYQEVNGMFFPFTTAQKVNGQQAFSMTADKIEINTDIDDKEFRMPEGE
ncbi:LolA-like protein [Tellurirhabdus rosea]|uniref:outer membrane lipoprotein-sorting protein n=1 Tax=Tellurirhabdus rosea TaxID=2674997 RepID=UPI00224F5059|nr:outer membrane lipoprotein-sorting protein [Tellurirhabdus rosea]